MLDSASKKQLAGFISSLQGHVASLLCHMVGSAVVEHAYELASADQKQELLLELCFTKLKLFKDLVLSKESRVLMEYFNIANQSSVRDIIQQLSNPLLVRMIGTRDGAKLGILCVKHGSAKERKKIIKGIKGHIDKIAYYQYGCMVLVCILSVVDDTKLIAKAIISEIQQILKELVLDKNGRCALLQLLHPNCSRYFSPDELSSLSSSIPSLSVKDHSEVSSRIKTSKVDEPSKRDPKEDMKWIPIG